MISTYSIVACDLEAGEWGVAVQSKFLAVGAYVPAAEAEVGAVATQALVNVAYGPDGLGLLRSGLGADDVVRTLVAEDEDREGRQLGVVDAGGRGATYTGSECLPWAGGLTGRGFAVRGNILVSESPVTVLASSFETTGGRPLAERLLAALRAAQEAGGDRRGQQSAALLVVRAGGGYGGLGDRVVDLRVDDHERPVEELERLYGLHQFLFGSTPADAWVEVDESLRDELGGRLRAAGYDEAELERAFMAWVCTENLEERVNGFARLDPVVLEALRSRTSTPR